MFMSGRLIIDRDSVLINIFYWKLKLWKLLMFQLLIPLNFPFFYAFRRHWNVYLVFLGLFFSFSKWHRTPGLFFVFKNITGLAAWVNHVFSFGVMD